MEKKLELVEKHEQKETFSLHFKPSFSEHKDDQPSDVKEEGYTNLFSEDGKKPVINSVSDGFKQYFSPPIYDQYEDDFLGNVPKQLDEYFVISGLVSEENLIAIHDQNSKSVVDNKHPENCCFPLCFCSFEMMKQSIKV